MALLRTRFKAFGRTFQFSLDTKKFSRNYDDEDYSYWIRCNHGYVFEINIWKKPSADSINGWAITDKGIVNCYASESNFTYDKECETHRISFKKV